MEKITGKSLLGRNVVSDRGTVIGKLIDLSIETVAGKVMMLVVRPDKSIETKYFRLNERGEILIPFTAVKAVKDVLIITDGGIPKA
ncbi:MAG: PRC-barrel domain-containing protein [Candidatus Hydrothermarchaeaceae archaeon]